MILNSDDNRRFRTSQRTMGIVALLRAGVADGQIAHLTGVSEDEVRQIDAADDPAVRHMAVNGLPEDFTYRLRQPIACRHCGGRIYLVPCVTCRQLC